MSDREEKYSDKEAKQRFDATLKRMLTTPHKPHKPLGKKKAKRRKTAKKKP